MSGRATSFGTDAVRYDRARPTYPRRLVDDLLAGGATRILDVGCGTGKAAVLFAERGCDVLGVEPDPRMADVARGHGIAVEVTSFEDWDPRARTFDLVVAAQAWHWLEPVRALPLVAAVLPRGGRLAAFWNRPDHDPETRAALDAAYAAAAPDLAGAAIVLGVSDPERDLQHLVALVENDALDEPEIRDYSHTVAYSRDEWVELAATHSDHIALPPEQRRRLLRAIGEAIDGLGGSLDVTYRTTLLTALRR